MQLAFDELPPLPDRGRRYRATRRVRLADVAPDGRMRLDAIARWLQDAAGDDVEDAGLHEPAWVVRRTWIQAHAFPRYRDRVEVTTFCWSMGSRFAERRTGLRTAAGGRVETLTLWVRLDPERGRPTALSDAFRELYAEAVGDRKTDHSLRLPEPPADLDARAWPLRHSDLDMAGHVNNTVYWSAIEDALAGEPVGLEPANFEMEFRAPIDPGADVGIARQHAGNCLSLWLVGERTHAAARVWPRDRHP